MSSAVSRPRVHLPSDSETYLAILFALADVKSPLTQAEIARGAKLQRQVVNYHIARLVDEGLVLSQENDGRTVYTLQSFFRDDDVLANSYKLMEHMVWLMSKNVDMGGLSKDRKTAVLIGNMKFFLALLSRDLERV